MLYWLGASLVGGPVDVESAIRRLEELCSPGIGDRVAAAHVNNAVGELEGLRGRFGAARRLLASAGDVYDEFGLRYYRVATWMATGLVERAAGDGAAAESAFRAGYDALAEAGEKAALSTMAAYLAHVLCDVGREEEAERMAVVSKEAAAPEDLASQMLWRRARARVLARRGRPGRAERLAREAVKLGEQTDDLKERADALSDLAEALLLTKRRGEAASALEDALCLYERKGCAVSASRARRRLQELTAASVS